jgi:hypothetical protein
VDKAVAMQTLLIQSCSKSKREPGEPVPALELYSGYYYKIIKKAKREGDFDSNIDICILSAKHGLIDSDTNLVFYDQKMDSERAQEIRDEVKMALKSRLDTHTYDEVLINMGQPYREAIHGIEDEIDTPIRVIEGKLGERGRKLKQRIRQSDTRSVGAD